MFQPFRMKSMKSVTYEDEQDLVDFDPASEFAGFAANIEGSDEEESSAEESYESDSEDSSDTSSEGSANKPIRFYFQQCYPYGSIITNALLTTINQLLQQSNANDTSDGSSNGTIISIDICKMITEYMCRCPQSIVIHLDSDFIRCGTVNTPPTLNPTDLQISICERSILGNLRPSNLEPEIEAKRMDIETDELRKTPYLMRGQLVTNCDELWAMMKDLVYYCVADTLEIPLNTHGVVFIVSPLLGRVNRNRFMQYLFRELPVPAVGFIDDIYAEYLVHTPASLYGSSTVVVHLGDTLTSVGFVVNGKLAVAKHSIMLTGRILTEYLMTQLKIDSIDDIIAIRNNLISEKIAQRNVKYETIESKEKLTIDYKLLHKCVDLFFDPKLFFSDLKPLLYDNSDDSDNKLSKCNWIRAIISKMSTRNPNPHFNIDSLISAENYRNYSHFTSITQMIIDCITAQHSKHFSDNDCINVIVCSGDMKLNGLSERLSLDLRMKAKNQLRFNNIQISQFSQCNHCVWKGGMIAAQLPQFAQQWRLNKVISKDKK